MKFNPKSFFSRFDGTKRQRELEARAPMWKIDLEIIGIFKT